MESSCSDYLKMTKHKGLDVDGVKCHNFRANGLLLMISVLASLSSIMVDCSDDYIAIVIA